MTKEKTLAQRRAKYENFIRENKVTHKNTQILFVSEHGTGITMEMHPNGILFSDFNGTGGLVFIPNEPERLLYELIENYNFNTDLFTKNEFWRFVESRDRLSFNCQDNNSIIIGLIKLIENTAFSE